MIGPVLIGLMLTAIVVPAGLHHGPSLIIRLRLAMRSLTGWTHPVRYWAREHGEAFRHPMHWTLDRPCFDF